MCHLTGRSYLEEGHGAGAECLNHGSAMILTHTDNRLLVKQQLLEKNQVSLSECVYL